MLNRTFLVPLSTLTSHGTEQVLLPHFPETSINGRATKKISKNKISKKVLMQKQSMYFFLDKEQSMYMMGIYEVEAINNGMPTKIIKRYVLVSRITSVLVDLKCKSEQQLLCFDNTKTSTRM
jgi:hypothetical protein